MTTSSSTTAPPARLFAVLTSALAHFMPWRLAQVRLPKLNFIQ